MLNHASNCFGNTLWPELVNSIKSLQGFPLPPRNHFRSERGSQRTDFYHTCLIPSTFLKFSKILKVYCVFKRYQLRILVRTVHVHVSCTCKTAAKAKTVTCWQADQGVGSGTASSFLFFSKFLIVPYTTY